MAAGDQYRRISPADLLVTDSSGAVAGIKSGLSTGGEGRMLAPAQAAAVQALVLPDGNLQYPPTTAAAFAALVAASGLRINAVYNVDGTLYRATSANTFAAVSTPALFGALTLSATTTGQRQALGTARQISLTCAAGCTLNYRFSDASAAIAASTSDTAVVLTTTAVSIAVPSGQAYLEYIVASGTPTVALGLLA